jgi:type II secretory pathway component PulC
VQQDIKTMLLKPNVPRAICFFLALLIVWQIITAIISLSSLTHSESLVSNVSIDKVGNSDQNIIALQSPFFGEYSKIDISSPKIQESKTNFKVIGIIYADDEQYSQAVISDGRQEKGYQVGDMLPGSVLVKSINPREVLISLNGKIESLSFPEYKLTFASPPKPLLRK